MEKRNLTPLRNVLVRYLVVCGGGSIVILLVWLLLFKRRDTIREMQKKFRV